MPLQASQVFKTVIECHHINISVLISIGTFFNCQYFLNILRRSKTGLGIPATQYKEYTLEIQFLVNTSNSSEKSWHKK